MGPDSIETHGKKYRFWHGNSSGKCGCSSPCLLKLLQRDRCIGFCLFNDLTTNEGGSLEDHLKAVIHLGSGCYDYRSPPFRVGVTVLLRTGASKHHAALFASGPETDLHNSWFFGGSRSIASNQVRTHSLTDIFFGWSNCRTVSGFFHQKTKHESKLTDVSL